MTPMTISPAAVAPGNIGRAHKPGISTPLVVEPVRITLANASSSMADTG